MEASGLILGILQYAGLYFQFNAGLNDVKMDNHVSGNALFIEVPSDITTHSGEDVEMACSFRGAGSTSYSLEIQWWYSRKRRDQQDFTSYATNNVGTLEEMSKDATKISVVKVAGSNISHKLRLTRVKPTDEGTYECHVIDHSGLVVQRYRVQAYLQVAPERSLELEPEHVSQQRSALPTGSRDVGGESSWQHL
ncbi:V-set and transmembrane domain-containing protein 2-like protein [Nothobranchius furzeri]|uniref:V-set and transmembrane domain containing 2 like n=1 Tax=Nothobranchius furzeri TaxID=105023 RepID=A0A1A8USG0_NOTFU|nr:V-set and transmembrane domain-containing protein 2-like protein [Nothobranchius furzeri]KAF7208363.1 V-set and transmembrane domain-containing protein 2-like protein [Nothobranchius furzeri]